MTKAKTKIDFAKYRTPELFDAILELVDWRGIFTTGLKQAAIACIVIGLSVGAALWAFSHYIQGVTIPVVTAIVLAILCIPPSLPAAISYAIAYLLRSSLSNMLLIVELMLETTKNVAKDIESLRSGDTEPPTPRELVQGVYLEIFLPIIEQIIASQLWIFAKPVLFLYRLTFGRLMRIVINLLPDKAMAAVTNTQDLIEKAENVDMGKIVEALDTAKDHIDRGESTIVSTLDWTKEKINSIGGRTKFYVMLPCYIISGIIILLDVLFIFVVWAVIANIVGSFGAG